MAAPGTAFVQRVAEVRARDLADAIGQFKECDSFADLAIYCSGGGAPVRAHRAVLCSLSPFLEDALAELDCCHCKSKTCASGSGGGRVALTLAEMERSHVASAIELLYTGRAALGGEDEAIEVARALTLLGADCVRDALLAPGDGGTPSSLLGGRSPAAGSRASSAPSEAGSTPVRVGPWASAAIRAAGKGFEPFEDEPEMAHILNESSSSSSKPPAKRAANHGSSKRRRASVDPEEFLLVQLREGEAERGSGGDEHRQPKAKRANRAAATGGGTFEESMSTTPKASASRRGRRTLEKCELGPEEAAECVRRYRLALDTSTGAPGSSGDVTCHVCGLWVRGGLAELTQHLCQHFSAAVDKDVLQEKTVANCDVCVYLPPTQHAKLYSHVAIAHGALREVIPTQLRELLFPNDDRFEKNSSPVASAVRAAPFDPSMMAGSPSSSSDVGSPVAAAPHNMMGFKKHEIPPPSSGILACFYCGAGIFANRAQLKQHMMHHYRPVIRNRYFPAPSKTGVRHSPAEISTECPIKGCAYRASFKSNRLEHLTMHIGLTHRKIMEYMPRDEWERVFGTCKRKSTLFFDPVGDDTSATKEMQQQQHNGENGNGDSPDFGLSACPMPGCGRRGAFHGDDVAPLQRFWSLREHLLEHFVGEIKGAMFAQPDWGLCADSTGCPLCTDWQGEGDLKALVRHMGLQHNLLEEVLPKNIREEMQEREKMMKDAWKDQHQQEEEKKDVTEETKENQEPIEVKVEVEDESNGDDAAVAGPDAAEEKKEKPEPPKGVTCHLCKFSFATFVSYKLHLARLHFGAHLRRDLAGDLAEGAGNAWRCQTCKVEQASEAALMHHLAVNHDKVLTYIAAEEADRVRKAFET